jgi:hypothetical protein
MPAIAFGVQSYQHESLPLSAQRSINGYLEAAPQASKTPAAVVCAFGIKPYLTVGTGPLRGGLLVNRVIYIVSGAMLHSIADGVVSSLGAIPGSGRVLMASDGSHLMIVSDAASYIWNGVTLTQITDGNFPGYKWMTYLDGYFIGGPGDRTFYINHTAFDPTVWNALDFASAESTPGDIITGITDHREIFLFKRDAVEVWYNSGSADFPLSRTASGYMEIGCTSTFGVVKADNSVFFPATDGTIRRVNGYTPVRISTTAIEQAIRKYASQECIAHTWIENGHTMMAFTYIENTFVFDASTQLWHERQSYGMKNWRAAFVLRGDNITLVGDATSNRLGILDDQTFMEWEQPLVSSVVSPSITHPPDQMTLQHAYLELIFEQGVGLNSGQGSNPKVMVQYSDNDGRTWGNEIWRSLGKRGDFLAAALINRLGQTSRNQGRVYKYSLSDPVRRTLVQAFTNNVAS